jgi:hypothetical protein
MSDEIISERINTLPGFGKIAFTARCVRIAWKLVVPLHWKSPPNELEEALQTVERRGEDIAECNMAKQNYRDALPRRTPEEIQFTAMLTNIRGYGASGGQIGHALASAVEKAIQAVLFNDGNSPETDEFNAQRAKEAIGGALHAATLCHSRDLFEARTLESFDKLAKHINDGKCPSGAVAPTFFTSPDPST